MKFLHRIEAKSTKSGGSKSYSWPPHTRKSGVNWSFWPPRIGAYGSIDRPSPSGAALTGRVLNIETISVPVFVSLNGSVLSKMTRWTEDTSNDTPYVFALRVYYNSKDKSQPLTDTPANRLIIGKRLRPQYIFFCGSEISVFGKDYFRKPPHSRNYTDGSWGARCNPPPPLKWKLFQNAHISMSNWWPSLNRYITHEVEE